MNEGMLQSARNGDQRAFAKLVDEYYRPIYGLAFSTVGNWQAAEDLAQDAFLVAWINIGKLRTLDALGAWLRRIVRNLACNWIRSECYRRALLERREALDVQTDSNPCTAVDNLAHADAVADTWAALAELSPSLREAVVLYYLEENSIAQTASMLGVTENSVKKRLQHARPQLRNYFEKQWKAEMDRERQRIKDSEASKRFMAGAALGPVSGLTSKLGTGAGLWLHGVLHGEGTGRLASMLGIEKALFSPALVALIIVAVSGAGLLWNGYRQESATENIQPFPGTTKLTLSAVPADVDELSPAVSTSKKDVLENENIPQSVNSSLSSIVPGESAKFVTVAGHIVDEEQHPVQGATVTVVASGLNGTPADPAVTFGACGGVSGGASVSSDPGRDSSSGGSGFGGGFDQAGGVGDHNGGGSVGNSSGGSVVGNAVGSSKSSPSILQEDALEKSLFDEARRFSVKSVLDGSFSIANVPGDMALILSVDAPGYCIQGTTIYPASGMSTTDLKFTLSSGVSITGRVLAANGQPITDALLQITALAWQKESSQGGWGKSLNDWEWVRTDARGNFTLTANDSGNATIIVRSKTYGKATFQNIRVESGVSATLRFPEWSVVRGKITNPNGSPAAGKIVRLSGHAEASIDDVTCSGTSGPSYTATTDVTGDYTIENVDPLIYYTAHLFDKDGTPHASGCELGPVVAGQTLYWNYAIPQPILVKGVVTKQASGQPASGTVILCNTVSESPENRIPIGMSPIQTLTAQDGTFEMRITTGSGKYAFGIQTVTGFRSLSQREVREGESVVLNLMLPGLWSRNFRVVDTVGNPLSGVSVLLLIEGSTANYSFPLKTGDDGCIQVKDLNVDEAVKCRFQYNGKELESDSMVGLDGMDYPVETIVIDLSK